MTDNPRIAELRRRVEKDPTSIAFAQLAEEYRRIGDYDEAVKACRAGLTRHPGYVSAQVTLGRALMELGEHDEARRELEAVLQVAPDNLAAIRALADIHERHGNTAEPVNELPRIDLEMPSLEDTSEPVVPAPTEEELPLPEALDAETLGPPPMPDFSDWALDSDVALDLPEPALIDPPLETTHDDPVLEELEQWLTAIVADRSR
jgi:tetratricopeptide (TPR) repeat protein